MIVGMDELEQLSKEQLIALHRAVLAVNRPSRRFDEVVEAMKRETAVLFDAAEVHVQLFDSYSYEEPLEPRERPMTRTRFQHNPPLCKSITEN